MYCFLNEIKKRSYSIFLIQQTAHLLKSNIAHILNECAKKYVPLSRNLKTSACVESASFLLFYFIVE